MNKRSLLNIFVFLLVFLVGPIYVTDYFAGVELGISHHFSWLGGLQIVWQTLDKVVSPNSYGEFHANLNLWPNILWLFTVSSFVTLLLAKLLRHRK